MGGAVSAGEDNEELVENLIQANYIRSPKLADVFLAVDRAHYYLEDQRNTAYYDTAWKHEHLHLSAPCIYSEVMELLDLQPGMSFLNLGSGTGYLSTIAGLLLGPCGINHGVEIHQDVVEYADARLEEFIEKCPVFDKFEFCPPLFKVGNCLLLPPDTPGYDRIYCGAACPVEYANYLMSFLVIGGKLVLPLEDMLQVKTRISENEWESRSAIAVSFAQLVVPSTENGQTEATPIRDGICDHGLYIRVCMNFLKVIPIEDEWLAGFPITRRQHRASISGRRRRRRNTFGDSDAIGVDDLNEEDSVTTSSTLRVDEIDNNLEDVQSSNQTPSQHTLDIERMGDTCDSAKKEPNRESSGEPAPDLMVMDPENAANGSMNHDIIFRFPDEHISVTRSSIATTYTLVRSIRRQSASATEQDDSTDESQPSDSDEPTTSYCKKDNARGQEVFPPLVETPFIRAIRKLPLPLRLISYLLYNRQ